MKTYEKVLLKSITTIIVLVYIIISMNLRVYASNTQNTLIDGTVVEKISNPDAKEGETDGLIDGGDRETSYAWAMATRGDYVYIGTNKNIVGGIANTFVQSMVSSGIPEDTAWELVNSMTNNEIPRPETEEGGQIFKCNINTGDIEVIYTAPKDVAFRMGIEFDGDLYFCSFSSDTRADNYIYKIDENDNITIAFTSKTGTSLRAACIYEDSLLFGGVDSIQIILDTICRPSKFPIGPTAWANPGPILPSVVIEVLRPTITFCSIILIKIAPTRNIAK